MKAVNTWILVADHSIVRVFHKIDGKLQVIDEMSPDKTHASHAANDAPGRVFSSSRSGVRHAYSPHMEATRHDAITFAHDVAHGLQAALEKKEFERLVIVAPPQFLGEIRAVLSKQVQAVVSDELHKEFTQLNAHDLQAELEKTIIV